MNWSSRLTPTSNWPSPKRGWRGCLTRPSAARIRSTTKATPLAASTWPTAASSPGRRPTRPTTRSLTLSTPPRTPGRTPVHHPPRRAAVRQPRGRPFPYPHAPQEVANAPRLGAWARSLPKNPLCQSLQSPQNATTQPFWANNRPSTRFQLMAVTTAEVNGTITPDDWTLAAGVHQSTRPSTRRTMMLRPISTAPTPAQPSKHSPSRPRSTKATRSPKSSSPSEPSAVERWTPITSSATDLRHKAAESKGSNRPTFTAITQLDQFRPSPTPVFAVIMRGNSPTSSTSATRLRGPEPVDDAQHHHRLHRPTRSTPRPRRCSPTVAASWMQLFIC